MPGRYPEYDAADLKQASGGNPFYNPYMKGIDWSGIGRVAGNVLGVIQQKKLLKEQKEKEAKKEEWEREKEQWEQDFKNRQLGQTRELYEIGERGENERARLNRIAAFLQSGIKYAAERQKQGTEEKSLQNMKTAMYPKAKYLGISKQEIDSADIETLRMYLRESVTKPEKDKTITKGVDTIFSTMEDVEKQLADIEKLRIKSQEEAGKNPLTQLQAKKTGQPIAIDPKIESNLNALKEKAIGEGRKRLVANTSAYWSQVPTESRSYVSSQVLSKLGKLDPNEFQAVSSIVPISGQSIKESNIPTEHFKTRTYMAKREGKLFYYDTADSLLKEILLGQ